MGNGIAERAQGAILMENPVFIFSAGWRTGSTLLQRLLNSHPEILVWGENGAFLDGILEARGRIRNLQWYSARHRANFSKEGSMGWIAVMNPPAERFDDGVRRLFEAYYRDPVLSSADGSGGDSRRCAMVSVQRSLSSSSIRTARFLLLLRHPEDCLASARARHTAAQEPSLRGGDPGAFLENWVKIASEFLKDCASIPSSMLYYEQLLAVPDGTVNQIAGFLDVDSAGFDQKVFDVRRRGGLGLPPRLTREDRQLLKSPWLWRTAEAHGYCALQPVRSSARVRRRAWASVLVSGAALGRVAFTRHRSSPPSTGFFAVNRVTIARDKNLRVCPPMLGRVTPGPGPSRGGFVLGRSSDGASKCLRLLEHSADRRGHRKRSIRSLCVRRRVWHRQALARMRHGFRAFSDSLRPPGAGTIGRPLTGSSLRGLLSIRGWH